MNSDGKKILKISSLIIFFSFIIIYAVFGSQDLIFGIKIKEVNLTDGAILTESVIDVRGNAKNAVILTLNGREISIDQSGNFKETIALLPGYNIVNIEARDKFGNVDSKNYKLILEKI